MFTEFERKITPEKPIRLTKNVLYLTKDPELIRKQLFGEQLFKVDSIRFGGFWHQLVNLVDDALSKFFFR